MRGEAQLAAIRRVVDVFGEAARDLVFLGGCAMALFARASGPSLRATKDVDCASTVVPWVVQEARLADLCARGVLSPDPTLQCRYRVVGSELVVDVLSPEGVNVGGGTGALALAVANATSFALPDGTRVRAVSPEFFLLMKLEAFVDRGPDAQSSRDAEDIVTLLVEIADMPERVAAAGDLGVRLATVAEGLPRRFGIGAAEIDDLVAWHLHRDDGGAEERVIRQLRALLFPKGRP